ncbi:MAG TPA: hypothetical protein VLH84_01120 [Patescibacteria group bacterium]|nr:hypothetical protein [Patescibacteria group bacterium]
MPLPETLHAESFLNYHAAWAAGQIGIAELLRIPRVPEVIDRVPNPDTFCLPEGWYPDIGMLPPFGIDEPVTTAREILLGAPFDPARSHGGEHAERLEAGFRPMLDIVRRHSLTQGVDLTKANVGLQIKVSTGNHQQRTFGIAHLDIPSETDTPRQALLAYSSANIASTIFFPHPFIVPEDADYNLLGEDYNLRAQADWDNTCHADPFDIVCFDDTLMHATPPSLKGVEAIRTFFRVWVIGGV